MKRHAMTLAVALVGAAATGWLWRDNRRLAERPEVQTVARVERELAECRADGGDGRNGNGNGKRGRTNPLGVIGAFGRALGGAEPEAEATAPEDMDSRRDRRQRRIREFLGRREGEDDAAYRERVAPTVKSILSGPRERQEERRRQFEEAAGVSSEQRARLDQAFAEGWSELTALANQSIAQGDLTPYRRNTRGVLAFVGAAVPTVDAVGERLREILTPEQQAIMEEAGFDYVEYLGVTSPWESVNPPPPEP